MSIAFDLDGVLVGDMRIAGTPEQQSRLLDVRCRNLRPIFQPRGVYDIITARPVGDYGLTVHWVDAELHTPPRRLFHSNNVFTTDGVPDGRRYKQAVLEENPEIDLYVENDPVIIEHLTACPILRARGLRVVNLPDLLARVLAGVEKN